MKGFVQTLEAMLAIIMIFTAIFVYSAYSQPEVETDLSEQAYTCLLSVENFRYYAYHDIMLLKSEISACMPELAGVEVKACIDDCSAELPDKTIYTASYLLAGHTIPDPKIIKIWAWSEL